MIGIVFCIRVRLNEIAIRCYYFHYHVKIHRIYKYIYGLSKVDLFPSFDQF